MPDVAVYRWDRIPWGPDGEVPADFYEPPDIAVEIVSPEQSRTELVRKCEWYVANGVPIALLIDPDPRTVRLFHPGEPSALLRGADVIEFAPVLPGPAARRAGPLRLAAAWPPVASLTAARARLARDRSAPAVSPNAAIVLRL